MLDSEYGMDPQGRPRFFGIYRAIVKDVNDPLKKSRIKVSVHMPTGTAVHNWAVACLPVTSNSNHPDHSPHTAAQIAALLTTSSKTVSDPQGGTITVPALTVVAKNSNTLKHPHVTTTNTAEKWNDKQETNKTDEHTPHRIIPRVNQNVWVMFIDGDPEYPVWMGIEP
jgi:hypothetical protein